MQALAGINMALAFVLELAMLAAFASFGFGVTDHAIVRWMLAIGLPTLVAGVWGMLLSPKAPQRVIHDTRNPALAWLVLACGAVALSFGPARSGHCDGRRGHTSRRARVCVEAVVIALRDSLGPELLPNKPFQLTAGGVGYE